METFKMTKGILSKPLNLGIIVKQAETVYVRCLSRHIFHLSEKYALSRKTLPHWLKPGFMTSSQLLSQTLPGWWCPRAASLRKWTQSGLTTRKAQMVVTQQVQPRFKNRQPLAADSSNETGTSGDITAQLAITAKTRPVKTVPSLLHLLSTLLHSLKLPENLIVFMYLSGALLPASNQGSNL